MSTEIFEETSERLIEPQVWPPEASDQVSEPLVSELVSHDRGNEDLVVDVGIFRIIQQVGFPKKTSLTLENIVVNLLLEIVNQKIIENESLDNLGCSSKFTHKFSLSCMFIDSWW